MYQIFRPSPKHIPYASYSKITKPNTVYQCDLIEIPYDEDVDTNLLDDSPIYYYVLLVIDCATRYKDFIFLISKSSHMGWFKELDFFYIKIILLNKYKLPVM